MYLIKKKSLQELIESSEGVHLTAYLKNRYDINDLKDQIQEVLNQAQEWLEPVLDYNKQEKFLAPIKSLLQDARIFKHMKGNVGIFRTKEFFKLVNIPSEVETSCYIADSFHVKPLLRWLQEDQEFLLLTLENNSAHLYLGSQHSLKIVDSLIMPDINPQKGKEISAWIDDWIIAVAPQTKLKLFWAGNVDLISKYQQHIRYKGSVDTPIFNQAMTNNLNHVCQVIRKLLKDEAREHFEKSLMEFHFASEDNMTRKNIFHIAQAVVNGKVKKLIVTDELSIFGKIDKRTGALSIHPADLDHEDDDILDDLAQMVLSQGGEVVIANQRDIPGGKPILAILEFDELPLEKTKRVRNLKFQEARLL